MGKKPAIATLALVVAGLFLAACSTAPVEERGGAPDRVYDPTASGAMSEPSIGESMRFEADGVSFDMRFVPGGITFPMDFYDFGILRVKVEESYWIADTETTFALWKRVYDWAASGEGGEAGAGAYRFANQGRQGGDRSDSARPVGTAQHPVTTISWRDAMIWCNALTEWLNAELGSDLRCVYYSDAAFAKPIRCVDAADDYPCITTPGGQDNPYIMPGADGFRLPTRDEWVLAARYRGQDSVNAERDFADPWFTKGDSASGALDDVRHAAQTKAVAWYWDNSGRSTRVVGTAGRGGRVPKTGNANTLGLYDMSGNARELSFDWFKPGEMGYCFRIGHSGSWADSAVSQKMDVRINIAPYAADAKTGFRVAKSP